MSERKKASCDLDSRLTALGWPLRARRRIVEVVVDGKPWPEWHEISGPMDWSDDDCVVFDFAGYKLVKEKC